MKVQLAVSLVFALAGTHGHVGIDYDITERIANAIQAFLFVFLALEFLKIVADGRD